MRKSPLTPGCGRATRRRSPLHRRTYAEQPGFRHFVAGRWRCVRGAIKIALEIPEVYPAGARSAWDFFAVSTAPIFCATAVTIH